MGAWACEPRIATRPNRLLSSSDFTDPSWPTTSGSGCRNPSWWFPVISCLVDWFNGDSWSESLLRTAGLQIPRAPHNECGARGV